MHTLRNLESLKLEVVNVGRMMHEAGLTTGTWGNISARLPNSDLIVITPSGFDKGKLSPRDMVVIRMDGGVVEGVHKPSIETPMHLHIYEIRPDVGAIVHTHSPMATSVGVAGLEIPAITVELAVHIGGKVPLVKYACPGTSKLGIEAAKILEDFNAAILESHGVVAVGSDLNIAFNRALMVEDAARFFIFAKILGNVRALTQSEIDEVRRIMDLWRQIERVRNVRKDWMRKIW